MTEFTSSRRDFVAGAALAGAAVSAPSRAQSGKQGQSGGSSGAPTAPHVDGYPKAPFPVQRQPWPGLTSKMTPRPDHGEASYKGSGRLQGKRALVTGGDSGIGRAAVIAFAREGADVAISYHPSEQTDAEEVTRLVEAEGRRCAMLPGDLRDERYSSELPERAAQVLGGLDILVPNAARQQTQPSIEMITSDAFDATMKTNIYAMFWLTKAAVPLLRPGSAIIVTTSEQAASPSKDLIDYAMTKAAGANFVKSMAKSLAERGIRVNGVAPGPIWTPLQISGGSTPEKQQHFGEDTPLGRAGQPAELAPLFVALADPMFSYSTGQIFGATGGDAQPS